MPLILGTNSIKDTGFDVANSCRFNSGSSDYLVRTMNSAPTNSKKATLSYWFKRTKLDAWGGMGGYSASSGTGTNSFQIGFNDANYGYFWSNSPAYYFYTSAVNRDPSAWKNVVISIDTTQGTESNRVKYYENGIRTTSFVTENYPSQNDDLNITKNGNIFSVGRFTNTSGSQFYYDGYFSEICLIDGTALDPTSFGEFDSDSGIWKPINVSGLTFGNNGFYLDFENSGSLGADVSGNSNNFTVNNLTSVDQSTDTCTNNMATMNSLVPTTSLNFSDGNLTLTGTNSSNYSSNNTSNFGVSSGKWYVEVEYDTTGDVATSLGISPISISPTTNPTGSISDVVIVTMENQLYVEGSNTHSYLGSTPTTGDIIQIALDMDNGKVFFGLNGTFVGDPVAGTGGAFSGITSGETIAINVRALNSVFKFNFGSPPFTISSGNTDGNGYGNFEFAVPNSYYSLNTKNLSEYG